MMNLDHLIGLKTSETNVHLIEVMKRIWKARNNAYCRELVVLSCYPPVVAILKKTLISIQISSKDFQTKV